MLSPACFLSGRELQRQSLEDRLRNAVVSSSEGNTEQHSGRLRQKESVREKGPSARQEGARQTKKSIRHFIGVGAEDQVTMCRVRFTESDKKQMSFYKLNNPLSSLGWLTCESCPVGIESLCWRVWALRS